MSSFGADSGNSEGPLQVLTLTPFYPSVEDEAEGCFVAEPIESLTEIGITSKVFAVKPFYRARRQVRESTISTDWLNYAALPGGMGLSSAGALLFAQIVGQVRALQGEGRVDLIHAHGALPCGHAAMLLQSELGIPYVITVHGLDAFSTEQVKGRAAAWCRRISQRVYRSARRVICISERVREQVLEGTGRACRTSVVYNGVNPEFFSPRQDQSADQTVVLSVGNLIPIKGHDVLIRAVAALAGEFPKLVLEIIGEGPERRHLRELARKLGIEARVRLLGRQSRALVAQAMQRCTVFALPSRYEGLGCVYLEAMASGKPVIGCRGQGIADIVQHGSNGFLVGPDNERELTLALGMLLRDEARRRNLGGAARETILERLTVKQQARNLARILRESAI